MTELLQILKKIEFTRIHFSLEFQETFHLTQETFLRLRKDLRRAARLALAGDSGDKSTVGRFSALFDPPLTADPVALKRYQRPGPPFVILPQPGLNLDLQEGDLFDLEMIFWGDGIRRLEDFVATLRTLGSLGLCGGEGRFELSAIEALDPSGNRFPLWRQRQRPAPLAPPLCDILWWLDTRGIWGTRLMLEFVTPARLLSGGKPLFRTTFSRLFPFILRRVTSMVHAHCGIDLVAEPEGLLSAARLVTEQENRLLWQDWRILKGPGRPQDLGGIAGHVVLEGDHLEEILWILNLGSLLSLGKGASFGAGHYRLREIST